MHAINPCHHCRGLRSNGMEKRRKLMSWKRGTIVALIALGVAFAVLRLTPSDDFVFLPNKARLVAPLVIVPDEQEPPEDGGIYMVDILVKRATLFEQLFPGLNDEATVIDGDRLNPEGLSDEQRDQRSTVQMVTSQEISAAVGLRALGYDVEAEASGVQVDLVQPDSGARGILRPGDVIVGAEGQDVATSADLAAALEAVQPGDEVTLEIERADSLEEVTIETTADEDDDQRALIGIRIQQAASISLPVDIEIDTGNVGGPSAGLAFALDIVDELGETDLDSGRTIIVTGELALDGTVLPIGGVKQKAVSARDLDADVFIVPADNADVARANSGDVDVIGVETFDEAIEAITGAPVSALALGALDE
jgi:PDZ domain-containing protein